MKCLTSILAICACTRAAAALEGRDFIGDLKALLAELPPSDDVDFPVELYDLMGYHLGKYCGSHPLQRHDHPGPRRTVQLTTSFSFLSSRPRQRGCHHNALRQVDLGADHAARGPPERPSVRQRVHTEPERRRERVGRLLGRHGGQEPLRLRILGLLRLRHGPAVKPRTGGEGRKYESSRDGRAVSPPLFWKNQTPIYLFFDNNPRPRGARAVRIPGSIGYYLSQSFRYLS
ncbi:hypothetical protein F4818DRAFT_362331 [Hypoxylon cercidicola]|nr:hypothetical protein F4818DRAFT_362331 [Hypoxylon cercidicola]